MPFKTISEDRDSLESRKEIKEKEQDKGKEKSNIEVAKDELEKAKLQLDYNISKEENISEKKIYVVDVMIYKENKELIEKVKKVCEDIAKRDVTFEFQVIEENTKVKGKEAVIIKVFGNKNKDQAFQRAEWLRNRIDKSRKEEIFYKVHEIKFDDD